MSPEVVHAKAVSAIGEEVALEIEVSSPPSLLTVRRGPGEVTEYAGDDLFVCMMSLRQDLERDGLLLCCQGARPDVFPSGMDSQMGDAREAHVLRRDAEERVDIFAPADAAAVGTLAAQRAHVMKFHGLDKKR